MNEVLVVGNGISRLLHERLISSWAGEMWACNRAYLEWGSSLTRLTGHVDVLAEALEDRIARGHTYEIWTGQFGRTGLNHECVKLLTCPGEFRKDSGTTLVAQALHEGCPRVLVCGFDLGGRDVYSATHYVQNKRGWTKRWHVIGNRYGWDRIEFVGFDHKPALQDPGNNGMSYYRRYNTGGPHIPDPRYIALYRLLYGKGETYDMRDEQRVNVRYIKRKPGWETTYRYDVAAKLADRGEVEILDEPDEIENVITEDASVTDDMTRETLIKIAKLRGLTGADRMKKDDLVAALAAEE